jgi:hypothetical protein
MAPPLIAIGAGVSAAGSLMAGQAAMAAGKYQKSISDRNADIFDQKANQALEIGNNNVLKFNKAFERAEAATNIGYIAAGVRMEGTPLEVLEHNLAEAEIERLNIMYDAKTQSYDFKQQAVNSRMEGEYAMFQARQQRASSFINAVGTVVGAAGQVYGLQQAQANAKIMIDAQAKNNMLLMKMANYNSKKYLDMNNALEASLFATSMSNQVKAARFPIGSNLLVGE